MLVSGAAEIVHAWLTGVGSTWPLGSFARTESVWACAVSEVVNVSSCGEVHVAYVPASSEHSNVEPASFVENLNVAVVNGVVAGGAWVMPVSGGPSTFHV